MEEPFIKKYWPEFQFLAVAVLGVMAVAYAVIVGIVLAVPHLPLANKRTFYALLRAQIAVDEGAKLPALHRGMVLFLGSSVVERGVSERSMDSVFHCDGIPLQAMNAGTGGFSAEANLPLLRAMLDDGLRPEFVVYGVGIQELNGLSNVHAFLGSSDTAAVKLKPKTWWNIVRFGPTALAPLLNADHLHQYLFAANNAFRDVPNLNLFDRLMFGTNQPPADSAYRFEQSYLDDLSEIVSLCKARGIKVALYNAPLKPRAPADQNIPYQHRADSYHHIFELAKQANIPIWNFDDDGLFNADEFQDNYHLEPAGAKKISMMLADSIAHWRAGSLSQDRTEPGSNAEPGLR